MNGPGRGPSAPITRPSAPIVQYWHDEEVPEAIADLMATFRDRNPGLSHIVFHERSAEQLIEEHLGARHAAAFRTCAVPAMQADYFRYCAVHALGGVYADASFMCNRELDHLLDAEGYLFKRPPLGPVLNGLFAFSAPGHPLLAMTIEIATRNIENRLSQNIGLTTGPAIFTALVHLQQGGSSFEKLRNLIRPGWRPQLDACWDELIGTIVSVFEQEQGDGGAACDYSLSTLVELDSLALKPRIEGYPHWAECDGSIFRPARSPASP